MSVNGFDMVGRKTPARVTGKEEGKKFKIEIPLISVPTETLKSFTKLIMYGIMGYFMISTFTSVLPVIQQMIPIIGLMFVLMIPSMFMTLLKKFVGE